MKIAFHAPLKAPGHPVPSGDRLMARQIIAALSLAGHEVTVASELRTYLGDAADHAGLARITAQAAAERARLTAEWQKGPPDLWFCYHPYYKAPDLIGPPLCAAFAVPFVTAEASYSARRNSEVWATMQAGVLAAVQAAALNLCLTARDQTGLLEAAPDARLARLRPFIDCAGFEATAQPEEWHLVTVAMMRPGDKMDSYTRLAAALALLTDLPWRLSVVGDGPLMPEVQAVFAGLERVTWHGRQEPAAIATMLARAALYVWPGCGEAYGLAYLEAQAAGVPVVACQTAGVPEVVAHGITGMLTPPGDDAAFAQAIATLLTDGAARETMGRAAHARVRALHSLQSAALRLDELLGGVVAGRMRDG